ncbi:putative reverse transcriptase domain-containing protein, partial [Tanacetum coccineum]
MTGIPRAITEHRLDTYPHIEPKVQKKRSLAPDRRKVVTDEVNEWHKAGIVRRVRYPSWVANPVLVKKVDRSWRMCIDFKDLNKACPKDLYPLPEIDWKIESLMGFKYKCFLDAYKGYHQIHMTKNDEEKTAFHTKEGVFCYTKMPFALKNAGATYQRLVDSAFKEQIGVNPEAYVDDMVIVEVRLLAAASPFLKVDLVKTYRIPLDLHPRFPDPGFTMDHLLDRRDIPDYLTWRHSCSCVSDDLPTDGYDRNDVERLCARLIRLCEMREEVLVRSRLSSVWFNKEYEIAAFLSDSRLVKKSKGSSQASRPSKKRKLQKRASEAGSSAPELDQVEGADEADLADLCAEIEDSLKRDEGISMRVVSAPTPRLGKRLGAPPFIAVVSASEPSHVGTSAPASTSGRSLSLLGVVASGCVGKSEAEVMRRQMDPLDCLACSALARDAEYDQIPNDDFGIATRGEEIDLTLFPLAPGPYHMPYPYEGISSPLKALDRTITPAELRRTESLLPLELSNHVNVLSALLISHGYELNSHYANLDSSKAHLHEKLNKKKVDVKLLYSEVTSLDSKLENLKRGYDALGQENRELCSQRDAAFEEVKKLQSQLTDDKTT